MRPLDLWVGYITDEIRSLAAARILDGGNLSTRTATDERTIKLALMVVRVMNPREELWAEEEAILMGVTRKRLKSMEDSKAFIKVVNS
jgi:hypothetical protein